MLQTFVHISWINSIFFVNCSSMARHRLTATRHLAMVPHRRCALLHLRCRSALPTVRSAIAAHRRQSLQTCAVSDARFRTSTRCQPYRFCRGLYKLGSITFQMRLVMTAHTQCHCAGRVPAAVRRAAGLPAAAARRKRAVPAAVALWRAPRRSALLGAAP